MSMKPNRNLLRRRFFLNRLEDRTVPATILVTNTLDAGPGSLRQAILDANNETLFPGADTIDATGVSGTITLTSTLGITSTMDILGSGQTSLIISGNNAVQPISINVTGGTNSVSISDLTVTAGKSTAKGGGILFADETLTLTRVNVTNNSTTAVGGGVATGNQSGTGATLIMTDCNVTGNTGTVGGGVYFAYNGQFIITRSNISGNTANGAGGVGGGALYFFGNFKNGPSVIRNSTISGNTADAGATSGGGGICLYQVGGTLNIENSTIANNTVTGAGAGGGIAANYNFNIAGTINLNSSIVADNSGGIYPDLRIDDKFTVISNNSGYNSVPSLNGVAIYTGTNDVVSGGLNLLPLASNGGPTQTIALGAGSTAINAGLNSIPTGVDARGNTYARKVGTSVDMGAFEFGSAPGTPTGNQDAKTLTKAGGTATSIVVEYGDDTGIDTSSLGNDDVRVVGPGGYNKLATLSGFVLDAKLGAKRVLATYSIPANSTGSATTWDGNDNGTYTVSVEAGKVLDLSANAVTADAIGTLNVNIPFPAALATAPNIQSAQLGTSKNTITVTYSHQLNILFSKLDNLDIRVTGPNGFNQLATFISAVPAADATSIVATYEIGAPGGTYDSTDIGAYPINIEPGQVTDVDGVAVPAGQIGSFSVAVPQIIKVNATNDESVDTDGKISFREALERSNALVADGPDTITFDPTVFAGSQTIALGAGQIVISDQVVVQGPGSSKLTVTAASANRHFEINSAATSTPITISGMNLMGGAAPGIGGSILVTSSGTVMSLNDMIFDGNTATGGGGAIGQAGGMTGKLTNLTISNSIFRNNTADSGGWGGAIFLDANTSGTGITLGNQLKITNTTFNNNASKGNAGQLGMRFITGGSMMIEGCTFSNGNADGAFGGAISLLTAGGTSCVIRNSTFSGNQANNAGGGQGGAIQMGNGFGVTGSVQVQNCTFAFNQSLNGGAFARTSGAAKFFFESCIIYNNTTSSLTGGIDFNGGDYTAKNCIIFSTAGATFTDAGGNLFGATADPLLAPLANNGGTTLTHLPGEGSPARQIGSNPGGASTDQRGQARLQNGFVDIGAVESTFSTPIGHSFPAKVTSTGATSYTFTVRYDDDTGIAVGTLDSNDVRVTGPGGFSQLATFVSVDNNTNGTPRIATYSITPPGGSWDDGDNGVYTVSVEPNQVSDLGGTFVNGGALNTFGVSVGKTFTVTATNDESTDTDGKVSLREAIESANKLGPSLDIIAFDKTVFASSQKITLSLGELTVTDSIDLQGTGAGKLTIDGGGASRIFNLNGPGTLSVTISDVTLSGGNTGTDGGAVLNDEVAVMNRVVMSGNTAAGSGGGFFNFSPGANTTINDSTITANTANQGGGFASLTNSPITVNRSVISNNSSGTDGGAMFFDSGIVVIDSSLVVGNNAAQAGGAVRIGNVIGSMTFSNSTFSGNTAATTGGAFQLNHNTRVLITNSTIVNNTAGGGTGQGGGIFGNTNANPPSQLGVVSSIVAGNNGAEDLFFGFGTLDFNNSAIGSLNGGATQVDNGGNLNGQPFANYKIGPLANNGGPTQTHALLAGSPLLDAGANASALTFDQRGTGFNRTSGKGTDIGAFELQVATPPTVTSFKINGGANQRSNVTKIEVTFSEAVTLGSGAFTLDRVGLPTGTPPSNDGTTLGLVNLNISQTGNTVTITFASGGVAGVRAGTNALLDGKYTFTMNASKITGAAGALDGNGDGTGGDNRTDTIKALFGDGDGDGDADLVDFSLFRAAFSGGPSPIFDFDGDGDVDLQDFAEFRNRFSRSVP